MSYVELPSVSEIRIIHGQLSSLASLCSKRAESEPRYDSFRRGIRPFSVAFNRLLRLANGNKGLTVTNRTCCTKDSPPRAPFCSTNYMNDEVNDAWQGRPGSGWRKGENNRFQTHPSGPSHLT